MENENKVINTNVESDNTDITNEAEDTTKEVVESEADKDSKEFQTLLIQKQKAREKADKLSHENEELKKKLAEFQKPVKETSNNLSSEEVTVARLEARGYIDSDEQAEILKASKALGISPLEAIKDEFVLARIERMRNLKKTAEATPAPKGKSGTQKRDVNWYIEHNENPEDSETREKVYGELARRAKENRIKK